MSTSKNRRRYGAALAAIVLLAAGTATPAQAGTPRGRYVVPGDQTHPEGIVRQEGSPYFYVGGTGDGTVYRGHVDRPRLEVFLPGGQDGRTTAVGMKISDGRLIVAGGATGKVFVYSIRTRALLHVFDSGATSTLVNDVAIAPNGDAYVSDSFHPVLYRITAGELADRRVHQELRTAVDFTGTEVVYEDGINGNGLVVTPDGRYVLMADTNSQALYRISTGTGRITRIDLSGVNDIGPDGMLLRDGTLYSVTSLFHPEGEIAVLRLSRDYSRATVVRRINGRGMDMPSTGAFDGGDMLVVNFQWQIENPHLPFTVVRVAL
ncbi:SMP-30/gluconolactonase/LRE family protein [Catenuloplanes japonicus]|uniref:SMP-30/gluconolactonase/LRE family protein n=1 Tax=Catenuloplanes japonicus TaxID=33876 RepID=UPI000B08BE92|nr:SMP-30/gluconolactonase/LRE family protein [Catenuloplanes japonicus]